MKTMMRELFAQSGYGYGQGMMNGDYGYGMGWGGAWLGGITMILVWALLVLGIMALWKYLRGTDKNDK